MTNHDSNSPRTFRNPLPGLALGDPFVLRHRGGFYLYGTNDGEPLPDGRVVPVFRSEDLITWEALGGALIPHDATLEHWAPEVLAWNGRFYMVVSYGDVLHRGHALWVATADRPEGPFRLQSCISQPEERFSIDGAWLLDDDGRLYLFRCVDFVRDDDPPHGTGIVVQPMTDPLTPAGPPSTVLRANAPWHLFQRDRLMPLHDGRLFAEWTTVEGPAPLRRGGRYYCGYSGGNYTGAYGTGEAVADSPLGPYRDLRSHEGPLFSTIPGFIEGPGHFSVVQPDLIEDWIVLHGRSPGEAVRRVWLCRATWSADGVTLGQLTDQPQPAPRRPQWISRFAGTDQVPLADWTFEGDGWRTHSEGLRHSGVARGLAWRHEPELTSNWIVELYVRFPEPQLHRGGVAFGPLTLENWLLLDQRSNQAVFQSNDGETKSAPLPTLGHDPFDFQAFHRLTMRCLSGTAEVWVDGVIVLVGLPWSLTQAHVGLVAEGDVTFDAVSITMVPG